MCCGVEAACVVIGVVADVVVGVVVVEFVFAVAVMALA